MTEMIEGAMALYRTALERRGLLGSTEPPADPAEDLAFFRAGKGADLTMAPLPPEALAMIMTTQEGVARKALAMTFPGAVTLRARPQEPKEGPSLARIILDWSAGGEGDGALPSCHVVDLVVLEAVQRRGLGRLLMAALTETADQLGAAIHLSVRPGNQRAYGLYASLGFQDRGPAEDGFSLAMRRDPMVATVS